MEVRKYLVVFLGLIGCFPKTQKVLWLLELLWLWLWLWAFLSSKLISPLCLHRQQVLSVLIQNAHTLSQMRNDLVQFSVIKGHIQYEGWTQKKKRKSDWFVIKSRCRCEEKLYIYILDQIYLAQNNFLNNYTWGCL